MQKPMLLNDDQVYRLLQTAFNTETVKELEKTLIAEAEQAALQATEGTTDDAKA